MASPRTRHLRNTLLAFGTLGLGLWLAGSALWQLGQTALFVHESVVVTGTVLDMRRKPFERWRDTLPKGHWSAPGDASYQPTVRFTLPGGINAIRIDMDVDNIDYQQGQEISIISPPGKPGKARINRWKFIWAEGCIRLGAGALLSLLGYGVLRRLKARRTPASPAPAPSRRKAGATSNARNTGNPGSKPRRKKKAGSATGEAAPGSAATKPRRSGRRKKATPQQPELPL